MNDFDKRAEAEFLEVMGKANELIGMMNEAVLKEPAKAEPDNGTLEEQRYRYEYALSFVGQTEVLANVLRTCNMPQETINMVLAARCGLPMQKIDPKSPCFRWVEEGEAHDENAEQSGGSCPVFSSGMFIDAVRDDLFRHTNADTVEAHFTLNTDCCGALAQYGQSVGLNLILARTQESSTQGQKN